MNLNIIGLDVYLMMNIKQELKNTFNNKKVLITGLTGYKGTWMACWLSMLGAKIWGASLENDVTPNIYSYLKIDNLERDIRIDLTNLEKTKEMIKKINPDYIFHLAAQPLVIDSIKNPIKTIYANTITSINILESLREVKKKTICIFVTTDKVYENKNLNRGYHENDQIGGKDIYSASKGMTEIIIKSYCFSFLNNNPYIKVATGRPCNCIGGGDWAANRLIPDIVKKWSSKQKVIIRNPNAIRPWQHVLEPVGGYLYLCYKLKKNDSLHGEAFNFGPSASNNIMVKEILEKMKKDWLFNKYIVHQDKSNIEAPTLKININKSKKLLGWKPVWNIDKTIKKTNEWYKGFYYNDNAVNKITFNQIEQYLEDASLSWKIS
jgi:CDP-glucose 4,6-dehydratase